MKKYLVHVPVADLRRKPIPHKGTYEKDPLQESQLLFEEKLIGKKEVDGWVYVEAIEQQKCVADGQWQGYPGWVQSNRLKEVDEFPKASESIPFSRKSILDCGKQFLNVPYFLGGRNPTCVDCSGLINLLYRLHGVDIPRDAHDQFLKCKKMESLEPADLVFLAKTNQPERMDHVMLFAGDDTLLEASMDAKKVQLTASHQKLGVPLSQIKCGDRVGKYVVYFGSLRASNEINVGVQSPRKLGD